KHAGYSRSRFRVNATTADSGACAASPADGIHFPEPPPRLHLAAGGLLGHAPGRCSWVDGITAADYEADLTANRRSLLDRAKSGSYRAPPVRRVPISKGPGSNETRPIGIPTLEDKVLQRAVVMLLQPISVAASRGECEVRS